MLMLKFCIFIASSEYVDVLLDLSKLKDLQIISKLWFNTSGEYGFEVQLTKFPGVSFDVTLQCY